MKTDNHSRSGPRLCVWKKSWKKAEVKPRNYSHCACEYVCLCVSAPCVCVCAGRQGSLALVGSLSRRRKTLIQNRGGRSPLASPCDDRTHQSSRVFPAIGFWVCFVGDVGRRGATSSHVKNLTAQTWQSTCCWSFQWPPCTPRSSRCRLQVYRCQCLKMKVSWAISTMSVDMYSVADARHALIWRSEGHKLVVWHSGSIVLRVNEVALRWARLVLGWVTVFGQVYHLGV